MNYLAHIYLSGNNKEIAVGNFMADSIKGKTYKIYPRCIQIGILLHREIDTFTDSHKVVKLSTKRLHKNYGHYSGVIVDIFYDHFLAKNWKLYSDIPLIFFCKEFYETLKMYDEILPLPVLHFMPLMISNNWLFNYRSISGIKNVLDGMNRKTNYRSKMNLAITELEYYYHDFEKEFTFFFNELITFSKDKLKILSSPGLRDDFRK